ncbi:MAG: M23 family metallopeptidase [Deltaproteobacteria bacterium]|nr:M23 family metallopeptidase [Deltaproteobacteria bacterium]
MKDTAYTLIVVPDHGSAVQRVRVEGRRLVHAAVGVGVVLVLGLGASIHYGLVVTDAWENGTLRDENLALRGQLAALSERVEQLQGTVDRVERFDQKLRALTQLSGPQRSLAVGPTSPERRGGSDTPFVRPQPGAGTRELEAHVDRLSAEATRQEQNLHELQAYFEDQKTLLASVPSAWPTRGWVTSDFGDRDDPYTSQKTQHLGMDIAAPHGKAVEAPAEGTVLFSGVEGGYGNVLVLDHGHGIRTRYGHLSRLLVKAGEKVKRGQQIGAVGSTGRSTGPHLHYEVRVNGVPQNPRKFLLEDEA